MNNNPNEQQEIQKVSQLESQPESQPESQLPVVAKAQDLDFIETTDMTIQHELFLEDTFLKKDREIKAQADQMPSVLVDEELLSELRSIPDRFGFKIGDVADLLGIKQYVLRYWEQEFEILKPKKASNNQRMYTKRDVENAFLIRKLLYRDKFSIEGARLALKDIKYVVKKEKTTQQNIEKKMERLDQSQHYIQEQIQQLITEIKKTKALFN